VSYYKKDFKRIPGIATLNISLFFNSIKFTDRFYATAAAFGITGCANIPPV